MTDIIYTPDSYITAISHYDAQRGQLSAPYNPPVYKKGGFQQEQDVYTRITGKVLDNLERGQLTWAKHTMTPCSSRPVRTDKIPFQGINMLTLWGIAAERGYLSPVWMTFDKAKSLKGYVNKGEKGTPVVYATQHSAPDDEGTKTTYPAPFFREYTVFNTEQISDLPLDLVPPLHEVKESEGSLSTEDPLQPAEDFAKSIQAAVEYGGELAYYSPDNDRIYMPLHQAFADTENFYATLLHELIHWTGHKTRLNRSFYSKRFGDGRATEELVAELGAAFLCADLNIKPEIREDNTAYIPAWVEILKKDHRAIFIAASCAQLAVEYLHKIARSSKAKP